MDPGCVGPVGASRRAPVQPIPSQSADVGMRPPPRQATRSRWMNWKPKARILADSPEAAPTKPTEPGFVGLVGPRSAESPKIEAEPDPAELSRASGLLNGAGVRIMQLEGGIA